MPKNLPNVEKTLFKALPVYWVERANNIHTLKTVLHRYTIRWDDHEQQFRVVYNEHATQESGFTLKPTIAEAKYWAEFHHYPEKMLEWFEPLEGGMGEK